MEAYMTDLTDKERYNIEIRDIAGQSNGLREFNALSVEDYLKIGYAFIQNDPHDFITSIRSNSIKNDEILSDLLSILNNLCSANKDLSDCKNELEKTYNYYLTRFVKNNRDIESDYNEAMSEAYEEFKRNPHDVDDIGD
jgi:hypothetical protein